MDGIYKEMDSLLIAWKLPQLLEVFREHEINLEALEALTEPDIIELITKIGPRALFRKRLTEWLEFKLNDNYQEKDEKGNTADADENIQNNVELAYVPLDMENYEIEIDHEVWIDNSIQDNISEDNFKIEALETDSISDDNEMYEVKSKKLKLDNPKNVRSFEQLKKLNLIKPEEHKEQKFMQSTQKIITEEVELQKKVYRKETKPKALIDIELLALKQNTKAENHCFLNVEEVLLNNEEGRHIIEKYTQNPFIDKDTRLNICDIIISEVYAKNLVMDRTKFQDIAQQIIELFPNEDIKTWFIPKMANAKNSGGSLFYKYYGVYRKKRKASFCGQDQDDDLIEKELHSETNSYNTKDLQDILAFQRAIPKYERLKRSCDFQSIDINTLLDSSFEGRGIKEIYEKYQTFEPESRNRLCKLIVMEAFHRNIKMQPRDFYDISCQIVKLFPNEKLVSF